MQQTSIFPNRIERIFDGLYARFDWIVLGLLVLILLIPKLPLFAVEGTYVHVRIEDFIVAAVYGLWVFGWWTKRIQIKQIFHARWLSVFLAYGLLITLVGIVFLHTVEVPHLGILHWLRRVEYLGMFLITATTAKRSSVSKYLYTLLVVGYVTLVYGALQYYDYVPGVYTVDRPGYIGYYSELKYLVSTFGAHYDYGTFLLFMVLVCAWGYLSHRQLKQRILFFVSGMLFWWMSTLVYGRAAYLGLLVSVSFTLFMGQSWLGFLPMLELLRTISRYFSGKFQRIVELVVPKAYASETPTSVPTIVTTPIVDKGGIDGWLQRNFRILLDKVYGHLDPSAKIRVTSWQDALTKLGWNFLWGGGYYSSGTGTDNDYLRHIMEVGVIGLSIFLLILLDFARWSWRLFFTELDLTIKHFHSLVIGLIIGLLIEALLIDIFASSKIAFLLWFVLGISSVLIIESQQTVPQPAHP